ncbi:MAG TPA: hypothetical protein VG742_15900, partial [Dongiaceae bacterium]|nr:hypothetical protein [Dongiaceae bacterium]
AAEGVQSQQPGNVRSLLDNGEGLQPGLLVLGRFGDKWSVLCALYSMPNTSSRAAFAALQPEGELVGIATCVPIGMATRMSGAAQAIAAEREAEEAGDGYAYWIVERETVIGLPDTK